MRGSSNKRKLLKYFVALVVLVVVGFVIRLLLLPSSASVNQSSKTSLKPALSVKQIQKDFPISLSNGKGEEILGLVMQLESVEIRDEIIVKGQKASSVEGRSFLVVNIKLKNSLEQAVEINSKDYLRLGVSENEWLAPDIHNDPVLVQAISTKPTRVAFPVNSDLRKFSLQLGEIAGDKEKLEIDFTQ